MSQERYFHIWMPDARSLCDNKAEAAGFSPTSATSNQIHQTTIAATKRCSTTVERVRVEAEASITVAQQVLDKAEVIAAEIDGWDSQHPWCPSCVIVAELVASWARHLVYQHAAPLDTPKEAIDALDGTRWTQMLPDLHQQIGEGYRLSIYPNRNEG